MRSDVAELNSRICDAAMGCSLKFSNLAVLHFNSSDAHSKKHRTPVVYNGLAIIEKKIGRDAVTRYYRIPKR